MSYLSSYLTYASDNEASPKFHKWCGLVSLSAFVGRRVWIPSGEQHIYPNLYVGLVGSPASGKSMSLGLAERVVSSGANVPVSSGAVTVQALMQDLGKKENQREFMLGGELVTTTPHVIFSGELVSLLGPEPQHMINFLTDLYDTDREWVNKTKNQGTDRISRPCLTLLGCITPTTLENMVKGKMVNAGFTRRMIPVVGRTFGKPFPFLEFDPKHKTAKGECIVHGKKLEVLAGPMEWAPAAKDWYVSWYRTNYARKHAELNSVFQSYLSAKHVILQKVALLLALSQEPRLLLTVDALAEADAWLSEVDPDVLAVWGGGGGRNELAPLTHEIEKAVKDAGPDGLSLKQLLVRFRDNARQHEMQEILNSLVATESITQYSANLGPGTVLCYRHRHHDDPSPEPPTT